LLQDLIASFASEMGLRIAATVAFEAENAAPQKQLSFKALGS
jgi:hypothetical protein